MIGTDISITFTVDHSVVFNSWVGRFVNRVVSEVLEDVGYRVSHASSKPFIVSPVFDLRSRIVNGFSPGFPYRFRASFFCNEVDCGRIIDAFAKPSITLLSGEVLSTVRVIVNEVSLNEDHSTDAASIMHWRVRYWPTIFTFRSHYIAWPSPARFLASAAQTLAHLLEGSKVDMINGNESFLGLINGIDLKQLVKDLLFNTDTVNVKARQIRLNLGNGRWINAFSGYAEYITYTEKPSLMKTLLSVANTYGVGKDRALGLGYVNSELINQQVIKSKD
ncbi:MAG: CRISPR system precrRNA processing endoribonuclease RAMP protein Cas6 [Thermocladium sp.]